MNTKDLNPVVNIGTAKSPLMVLCATTMMMLYQADTGKSMILTMWMIICSTWMITVMHTMLLSKDSVDQSVCWLKYFLTKCYSVWYY